MTFYDFCIKITQAAREAPGFGFKDEDVQLFSKGCNIQDFQEESLRALLLDTNRNFFNETHSDKLAATLLVCFGSKRDKPGHEYLCRINVESLWDICQESGWDAAKEDLYTSLQDQTRVRLDGMAEDIGNFESIKHRLIVRPVNIYRRRGSLENMLYSRYEDIALALYIFVNRDVQTDRSNFFTVRVTRELADCWGVDETVLDYALENTMKLFPPRLLVGLQQAYSKDPQLGRFMDVPFTCEKGQGLTYYLNLTTTVRTNGAISVFYPGVADRLVQIFGEGFYCAFTSMHEAVIHPRSTATPQIIKSSVADLNRVNPPEDVLTNTVLYYDPKRRTYVKK